MTVPGRGFTVTLLAAAMIAAAAACSGSAGQGRARLRRRHRHPHRPGRPSRRRSRCRRGGLGRLWPFRRGGPQDGRYLLAVDAGSNQISVLRVTAGGVPVLAGQPVSSGGIKPVSVAVSPSGLVYVANSGAGGSNYTGFRLGFNGTLTPVPGSTYAVPDGSGLGDVFFNAFGNHLIGTRTGTSLIDSFLVAPNGRLLAAPLACPSPGRAGPARRRVLADPPLGAVRHQRAQRGSPRHRVRLPRQPARPGPPDRLLALRRRADRTLLGGDQPRRQVPVRRQHRLGQHLQLRHQPRADRSP